MQIDGSQHPWLEDRGPKLTLLIAPGPRLQSRRPPCTGAQHHSAGGDVDNGYHLWTLSNDFRVWRMLDTVGRRQQTDDTPIQGPAHFLTRSGATEYVRRNLRGRGIQVRACTRPNCAFQHNGTWLAERTPEEIEAVRARKLAERKNADARRKLRDEDRAARFAEAGEAAVTARLKGRAVSEPPAG